MFSYCENKVVNHKDSGGEFLCSIIGAAVGAIAEIITRDEGVSIRDAAIKGGIKGFCSGFAADVLLMTGGTAGVVMGAMALAGAVGAYASNVAVAKVNNETVDWNGATIEAVVDATTGAFWGYVGGPVKSQLSKIAKKGFAAVAKQVFKNEVKKISTTIGENVLESATTWLGETTIDIYKQVFISAFIE